MSFDRAILGRTGLEVGRIGISATYGVPADAVEHAFDRGVNYLYWGSLRTGAFARALRNLAPRRERMVLVIQSYSRVAGLVGWSLERALRRVKMDYADVLLLGMWGRRPGARIVDACRRLRERGLVRHLALSTHRRPLIPELSADPDFEIFHLRYNAVHRGAERDVFARLSGDRRPGLVGFTATCWRQLLGHRRIPSAERTPSAGDCYRFVLTEPAVNICLTGPSSRAHVDEALAALQEGPLDASELEWMRRVGAAIYGKKR
jgi:aryl-alcohol dehydrogenase-like predicted oxidoreductase